MKLSSKEASALRVVLLSVLSIAVGAATLWLLWSIRSIVFLTGAAAFAAFLFLPIANWLSDKTHLRLSLSSLIVVLAVLALLAGVVMITVPPLVQEIKSLLNSLPDYVKTLQNYSVRFFTWLDQYNLSSVKDTIASMLGAVESSLVSAAQNLVTASSKKLLQLGILVPFFVLMYFFMSGSHIYYEMCLSLPFVRTRRDRAEAALGQVAANVRKYMQALAVVAGVTALLLGGVSALFGIRYALTIGIVDFIAEFIPYAGPAIVALLGAFFAAVSGPGKLLAWVIIFTVVEVTTSQILSPRLISEKTGLNPGVVIVLLLAGERLGGFYGLLLVVPAAVFVRQVARSFSLLRPTEEETENVAVD